MPLEITCVDCRGQLRIPDAIAGKKVKCPQCGAIFTAPDRQVPSDEPAPLQAADPDEIPMVTAAPPLARGDRDRWLDEEPMRRSYSRDAAGDDDFPTRPPKKSRLGLILGIVAVLLFAGIGGVVALVWYFNKPIADADWQTFTESSGKYTIEFPGKPKQVIEREKLPGGGTLIVTRYELLRGGWEFGSAHCDYPIGHIPNPMEVLRAAKQGFLQTGNTTAKDESAILSPDGNHVGIQFSGYSSKFNKNVIARFYLVRNRLIMLIIAKKDLTADAPEVKRFFDSFDLYEEKPKAVIKKPEAPNPTAPAPQPTSAKPPGTFPETRPVGTPPGFLEPTKPERPSATRPQFNASNPRPRPEVPSQPFDDKDLPKPKEINESVKGDVKDQVGITATEINVAGNNLLRRLTWSQDGKAFFTLSAGGTLRRIALEKLREETRLEIGKNCSCLAMSADGLVVTLPDAGEVWVVDPDSLRVRLRMRVPKVVEALSAPPISVAVAVQKESVSLLDLGKGEIIETYKPWELGKQGFGEFRLPAFSPDGKYFFAMGGENLQRYKLDGRKLLADDSTKRIGQNGQRIDVSPDGAFVALPSGGGNYAAYKEVDLGNYGTYVFNSDDFSKPAFAVPGGAYPQTLGVDVKGGLVYAHDYELQLKLYDLKGKALKEYSLTRRGDTTKQILPHPEGKKMLLLTESKLFHITVAVK